jgi:hypothetical protein
VPSLSPAGLMASSPVGLTITPVSTGLMSQPRTWSTAQPVMNAPARSERFAVLERPDRGNVAVLSLTRPRPALVTDSVLNELASDVVLVRAGRAAEATSAPDHPWNGVVTDMLPTGVDVTMRGSGQEAVPEIPKGRIHVPPTDSTPREPASWSARLAIILLAAGPCAYGASEPIPRNQRTKGLRPRTRSLRFAP